jgi:hypothetical protein
MKNFNQLNLEELHNAEQRNNVTIYIAASEETPEEKENKHRIKLKNKITEAKEMLVKKGIDEKEAENYLKSAYDVLEDKQLLRNLWGGMAIFLNKDHFFHFNVTNNWKDMAYVGDEFYLAPVIEPILNNHEFYILSINLSQTKLFKADKFNIREIEVEDFIPENMEEAIGFDYKDKLYQHVSAHTGQGQTFYHGHAEGEEEKKQEIRKFLNYVNDGLMKIMHNKTQPLIIESVDYIFSFFKEINDYKNLMNKNISLSPEEFNVKTLHEKAWNLLETQKENSLKNDIKAFRETKNKSDITEDIVLRTMQGRVDTLFVNKESEEWGIVDKENFKVITNGNKNPDKKELANFAIVNTYFTKGKIHLVHPGEMPEEQAKMCAIYRY